MRPDPWAKVWTADEMKVALGTFVCSCLEAQFGPDIARGVVASAMRHYDRRLRSSTRPLPVPAFTRVDSYYGEPLVEMDLALEPAVCESLQQEARRQAVDLSRLFNHAVFVYLADMELDMEHGGRSVVPLALAR
jgi:hypothetical protein